MQCGLEGDRPDRRPSCRRIFVVVPEPSRVFHQRPASRTAARQLPSSTGSPTSGSPQQARDAGFDCQRSAETRASPSCSRTISGVLDILTVFPRISEIANKVVPHDALAMVFVDRDRHFVRQALAPLPLPRSTSRHYPERDGQRISSSTTSLPPCSRCFNPPDDSQRSSRTGFRALLSVRLPAGEQAIETPLLGRSRPGAFAQSDVPLARRIADYVALSVSREQLVEAD